MGTDHIILAGVRENNLKNISIQIPKRQITVITGVSGSGKSSLVFDTIAQEAGRQLNETFSFVVRLFLPRYSQPDADIIENLSATVVIDQHKIGGNVRSTLGTVTDINTILRVFFSRFGDPYIGYGNSFSFNTPDGMCPVCEGIGQIMVLDTKKAIDMSRSLNDGAILLPGFSVGGAQWGIYAKSGFFDNDKKIQDYSDEELEKLIYAKPEKRPMQYQDAEINITYEGLAERFIRLNTHTEKERSKKSQAIFEQYSKRDVCFACNGKRYNERALSSKIMGYSIFDMTNMQIDELIHVLRQFDESTAQPIVQGLIDRLQILIDIGLDYLTLTRETATLSGGESQRVKLVRHLSSSLTDMLYIFDEPSIGLHPRDVHRMNDLLLTLRDKGNTILVVEHDPDIIKIADYIVDMGPRAGIHGGEIVYAGGYDGLLSSKTLTGKYLRKKIDIKKNTRTGSGYYESKRSSLHNLKGISLKVPKETFTAVTGVAGSGKSTLVHQVFVKTYPEASTVDQSPVHTNSRSNPATYSGVMDTIRALFADANDVNPGFFSYNSKGACEICKGTGTVELNLSFMDTMIVPCEECNGNRFKRDVLQYQYKGKNIVDVMEMTIEEGISFFDTPQIQKKLKSLNDVGLGYMTLGQPLSTLSGGECQRLKLARELNKKGNIYILDEPTTGLHRSDIEHILSIIDKLVNKGNTVIVIEHNLDVIKHADWIIDMGPDSGNRGGEILFEGTPKDLQECKQSITAKFLRESLV